MHYSLVMDGVTYRLQVPYDTIRRSSRIADGQNAGDMLSGLYRRDLIGTYYDYELQVEMDPRYPQDYNAFFEAITAPVESHTITMPYGAGTITYQAMVTAANDTYRGTLNRVNRWAGLTVSFTAQEPQRTPDETEGGT